MGRIRGRSAAPGGAIRVYLADTQDYFRTGLRELLQGHDGIEVAGECADPLQAALEIGRIRPDVVIQDVSTPLADGAQAEALARAVSASSRVILLLPHATTEHVLHAIDAGACAYLLKSCAAEEIVDAVRAVFRGRRYLSPKIADLLAKEYLQCPWRQDGAPH